jgi:fibronectin type 3 domain-containing protein
MRRYLLRLLSALGTLPIIAIMFTACATVGPPLPPSLELPKPPTDLRAARKGDRVMLTWTVPSVTTDRKTIRSVGPTRICRGLDAKLMQCGVPVGEAAAQTNATAPTISTSPPRLIPTKTSKQKVAGSYTDSLPVQLESDNASGFITYAVEVLNTDGRGAGVSNQVRISLVRTLPPPRDFAARVTGGGVVLTWMNDGKPENSGTATRYLYRIYRRLEGSQQETVVGEIPAGGASEFTDSNFEWEKTYEYHAETVTLVAQEKQPVLQVEGDDSAEVKVFADDVFPPAVPSGVQAVFSGPGQKAFIDLVWAPAVDVDLDGYNIYRREEGTVAVKVNSALVKTPAYRDENVVSGKRYFYSVSAVDVRGNESARSEEAGESVP